MTKLRIAIITYNWPPRNAIGTHRPYAWAKTWDEAGAQVTVITAQKHAYDAPLDLALPILSGVQVKEVPYGGIAGRVGGGLLKSEFLRGKTRAIKAWLRRLSGTSPDVRAGWRPASAKIAREVADESDVVISTFGPAASHLLAYDMKLHNPDIFWMADYRDLWSQSHLGDLSDKARSKLTLLERSTVGVHADALVAVSEDMVSQLQDITDKPVRLVPNGFDIDQKIVEQRLTRGASRPSLPLRIVHTGMLYRSKRDPEPLLRALVVLREQGKIQYGDVTVDFYGARIELARELAKHPDYSPFVRLIGHVPRDEALAAQQDANLLLILESPTPEARGVLTGKVFEYIASGRPILCLGSLREYELPKLLVRTGTGVAIENDEIDALADLVYQLANTEGHPKFYSPVLPEVLKYSRQAQAMDLLGMFKK